MWAIQIVLVCCTISIIFNMTSENKGNVYELGKEIDKFNHIKATAIKRYIISDNFL